MDGKTLKALRESIEKWERNAVAETPDDFTVGTATCALCEVFQWQGCAGCPVQVAAEPGCRGTPYYNAAVSLRRWRDSPTNASKRDAAHAAARAEVAFLRSLLPDAEADE